LRTEEPWTGWPVDLAPLDTIAVAAIFGLNFDLDIGRMLDELMKSINSGRAHLEGDGDFLDMSEKVLLEVRADATPAGGYGTGAHVDTDHETLQSIGRTAFDVAVKQGSSEIVPRLGDA
jgi:hypothetical protein